MRLFLSLALSSFTIFSFAQTNVGIGIPMPTNRLHVVNTTDPLRLEGVASGVATDSILTINGTGVVKRRSVANVFSSGTGWLQAGNVLATNNGTTFLGTTNTSSLFFRTNNQRSGFIDFDETKRNNSIGNRALGIVTTGIANNAFGYQALNSLTTGINNVAFGDSAAFSLSNGNDNVLIGTDAGLLLGSGFQNIAIGSRTMPVAIAASDNIAIGNRALENNLTSSNIAIGSQALNANNASSDNLAIGVNALSKSTGTGANINVAIGNGALSNTTTSTEQVAIGFNAGLNVINGVQNTIIGNSAFGGTFTAATTINNTIVGFQAGGNHISGSNNTYLGWKAGPEFNGASGSNNTYVGYAATSNGNYSNSSALGSGAVATNNNMVRIGNTSVTVIGGAVGFSNLSDERIKTNVQEDVKGLPFISLLRPVTYNYDLQKADDIQKAPLTGRTSYTEKQAIRYSGFLAQEVEAAAQKTGYNFSGVNKPQNEQSLYSINYSEIVVPLVKAVQELKAIVEKQQQEIEKLKALVDGQRAEKTNK